MSDILDEIIDRLPSSTVRLIQESNSDRLNQTTNFNKLLHDIQQLKIKQTNRELQRKILDIKSKTAENKNFLLKLKNELEILKCLKKTPINEQSVKAYSSKIVELESKIKTLTKDHFDVDLAQLFSETEDLNRQIEDYKKKITEAKSMYQSYDGFPPDIESGREVINKIKERIKENESVVESFFQPLMANHIHSQHLGKCVLEY